MSENLPHRTTVVQPMQAAAWHGEFPARLHSAFPALACKTYLGQNFVEAPLDATLDLVAHLKTHEAFDMLTDLTAVDYPAKSSRFELIYILYSLPNNERVRLKTRVALHQAAPSITRLFAAADWLEREVFDMFGIPFEGHPNLKRILMPDDWTGYPLRKELAITAMDDDWVRRNLGIPTGQ